MDDSLSGWVVTDCLLLSHVWGCLRCDAWLLCMQVLLAHDWVGVGCSRDAWYMRGILRWLANEADSRHLHDGSLNTEHDILVLSGCWRWYHAGVVLRRSVVVLLGA